MKMSTEKYLKMYSAVYSRPKIAKLLQTKKRCSRKKFFNFPKLRPKAVEGFGA